MYFQMLYLTYGTQQVMERGFRDLEQRLELYLDGVRANLPSIESVVVLNIPSWGAGVHLWSMGAGILNIYYCSFLWSWEIWQYTSRAIITVITVINYSIFCCICSLCFEVIFLHGILYYKIISMHRFIEHKFLCTSWQWGCCPPELQRWKVGGGCFVFFIPYRTAPGWTISTTQSGTGLLCSGGCVSFIQNSGITNQEYNKLCSCNYKKLKLMLQISCVVWIGR